MNTKNKTAAAGQAAALPKTRKTVTNIDVLHLANVVQLAAFAAEAKRTLDGIGHAAKVFPEVDRGIRTCVTAPGNWSCFEAPISSVLSEVSRQLEKLADDIEIAEDGNEF